MAESLAERFRRAGAWFRDSDLAGAVLCVLVAAAVFGPPVVYQVRHFHMGWYDVGVVRRAIYDLYEQGRMTMEFTSADDWRTRFILEGRVRHVIPFYALLAVPIKLFDSAGYVALCTAAMTLAAGYVFAFSKAICRSAVAGWLCAAAYIANPYMYATVLSMHYEAFAVLFVLGFAYHSYARQTVRAWLMLILALTVKEDIWVYAVAAAVMAGRRTEWRRTAAYVAASAAYYAVIVLPAAHALLRDAHLRWSATEYSIGLTVLRSLKDVPALLFSGPGLSIQLTFLFLWILAGWRCLPVFAILALWRTLPIGQAWRELAIYYSFPILITAFIALPFALNRLQALAGRVAAVRRRPAISKAIMPAALGAVIVMDLVMHVPGYIPPAIVPVVGYEEVYSAYPNVKIDRVRYLIDRYLQPEAGSVLAQFFTIAAIRERPGLYFLGDSKDDFLSGRLRPDWVLLDLGCVDPHTPVHQTVQITQLLRTGREYEAISDAEGVLLYRRRR